MSKLAVIQFPGSNCEYETQRAAESVGFQADILRWNTDLEVLATYDAYIIPGGFSYQDRVRAGAIAAKLPIMTVLKDAADAGKPILGICNGCQILAETGLLPDISGGKKVEIALARNVKNGKPRGFVCNWEAMEVKNESRSLFTKGVSAGVSFPIPINHGEGRFLFSDTLNLDGCMTLHYTGENPNGSTRAIAGIANSKGNVLALMPHPERATFLKQVPFSIGGQWAEKKDLFYQDAHDGVGPCEFIFRNMYEAVQ